ncbi:MAG: GNAT family N-acetyltransferase [Alphaproteobacteria bacterium]|nr:GNAT family N-acetyltransferase [Alphaproteobacteria bacterium]
MLVSMQQMQVAKLASTHNVLEFDCGNAELNQFLHKYAYSNQQSGFSVSYVLAHDNQVLGYYSLAAGSIEPDQANQRTAKGAAKHPIPVMVLARLAIDSRWQNQKLGQYLLRDALLRIDRLADEFGIRAVLVHAKNQHIKAWYESFGFAPSPFDDLTLLLILKDLRKFLTRQVTVFPAIP